MRACAALFLLAGAAAAAAQPQPRAVRPQDDLFGFVNGDWLERVAIPPHRVTYGTLIELAEQADLEVREIIEEAAARPRRTGPERQIADLYASLMNEEVLEAQGTRPIAAQLGRLAAIRTRSELAAEAGRLQTVAAGGPFTSAVATDASQPETTVVRLALAGTLLPERDHYLGGDERSLLIHRAYESYLARVLEAADWPQPAAAARAVVAFERELARAMETFGPAQPAKRATLAQLQAEMPGFDWAAWARPQGIERAGSLLLAQPESLRRFAALAAGSDLEGLKAWLVARYLTALAPYLPRAFADARFEFFGRVLTGQPEPFPRWQRGVSLVNGYLADAVGRRYVERHLPPQARSRAEALLARVLEAYREAVREADWMTAAARREALLKLARLRARVGQPDAWRDYGRLVVKADDLLGNVLRARELEAEYRTARVRQPDDHREWLIAAQAVNAYYAPATNEIVVTAAILQPPLFDPEADDASNLGAIGAVIGHELTHALDQDGRRFDARGAARDWWRPEDERAFLERARALAAQHAAQPLAEGLRIEGERTLRESVADLSGLSVAFRAYRRSLGGRPSPVRDGFTGEQRFFLSWARAFCGKIREEHVRQWLLTNPYPPPLARANVPAANLDAFQQAFGVESGDRLYVAPQKRVRFF